MRRFIYGPGIDEPICMIDVADNNAVYYYHFDGLGSVVAITNANANVVESYSYDVFGQPSTTSSVGNPYMFTGRRFDEETELYYYRARYYDPWIGRFLQTDPIGYYDSMNLYEYCWNNPVNWVDPWGLRLLPIGPEPDGGGFGGGFGGFGGGFGGFGGYDGAMCKGSGRRGDSLDYGHLTLWDWTRELSLGFFEGAWHGTQIAASEYTFGLSDRFGWTRGGEYVDRYGAVGTASKWSARVSRDAFMAAAALRVGGIGSKIHKPHGPHHRFPLIGKHRHLQTTIWRKGVSGSDINIRIPY